MCYYSWVLSVLSVCWPIISSASILFCRFRLVGTFRSYLYVEMCRKDRVSGFQGLYVYQAVVSLLWSNHVSWFASLVSCPEMATMLVFLRSQYQDGFSHAKSTSELMQVALNTGSSWNL